MKLSRCKHFLWNTFGEFGGERINQRDFVLMRKTLLSRFRCAVRWGEEAFVKCRGLYFRGMEVLDLPVNSTWAEEGIIKIFDMVGLRFDQ